MLAIYHLSGPSTMRMIFFAPLTFGLGMSQYFHGTHALISLSTSSCPPRLGNLQPLRQRSFRTQNCSHDHSLVTSAPSTPGILDPLMFLTVFQLGYTTLFGFHASYLFLRTGSILPPITAHIFCNIMGIPEIAYELKRFPRHKTGRYYLFFPRRS